ncbi:hypothetical protein JL720_16667 [Aureococcus anophagefferens]|nr:hypothetical protein JL720_16667 [Aureococcus anophagefferens]
MGKLDGKVCIVTGASSGIGLAVATALAGEGAKVVMVSRSITQEKASAVKGDTVAVACDVVKRETPRPWSTALPTRRRAPSTRRARATVITDAAKTLFGALTVYNAAKAFVSPGDTATNLIQRNDDAEAAEKMGVTVGAVVGGGDVGPACSAEAADAGPSRSALAYVGVRSPHRARDQIFGDLTSMNA